MIDPLFFSVARLGAAAAAELAWKKVKDSALRTLARIASEGSVVGVIWSDQSVEDLSARTTEVAQAAEIVSTVTSQLETEAAAGQGSSVRPAEQGYEAGGPETVRIKDFTVVYRLLRDTESARLGRQGFVVLRIIDNTDIAAKVVAGMPYESQAVE